MNENKFLRELPNLIYYVREYGISRLSYPSTKDSIFQNNARKEEFFRLVHEGFYLAQDRVTLLLRKNKTEQRYLKMEIANSNRNKDKKRAITLKNKLKQTQYHERILRKVIDSIAWQLFHYDMSTMRQLYCGNEFVDVSDSNLDSEIKFVEQYKATHPNGFALILVVNGHGIEIIKNGASITLGQGIMSRMYSGFTLPSSVKEMLMLSLNRKDVIKQKINN